MGPRTLRISFCCPSAKLQVQSRRIRLGCSTRGNIPAPERAGIPQHPRGTRTMLVQPRGRATLETRPGTHGPGRRHWATNERHEAILDHAIDGDTCIVLWPDPQDEFTIPDRIRLAGVDAPEIGRSPQPGAIAAREHLQSLAEGHLLTIIPTKAWPDKYGRLIARIYTEDRIELNMAMIVDGFATEYRAHRRRGLRKP